MCQHLEKIKAHLDDFKGQFYLCQLSEEFTFVLIMIDLLEGEEDAAVSASEALVYHEPEYDDGVCAIPDILTECLTLDMYATGI